MKSIDVLEYHLTETNKELKKIEKKLKKRDKRYAATLISKSWLEKTIAAEDVPDLGGGRFA